MTRTNKLKDKFNYDFYFSCIKKKKWGNNLGIIYGVLLMWHHERL